MLENNLKSSCHGVGVYLMWSYFPKTYYCSQCHQSCSVVRSCLHGETVTLNEEGHAGIYCVDCNEKLEDGC